MQVSYTGMCAWYVHVRAPQLGHQRTLQQNACNHKQKQKFTRVRVFNILNAIRQLCTHGKTTESMIYKQKLNAQLKLDLKFYQCA